MSQSLHQSSGVVVDVDDWHAVTDAKQRKRIQDRLAQRARRRRLKESQSQKSNLHQQQTTIDGEATISGLHDLRGNAVPWANQSAQGRLELSSPSDTALIIGGTTNLSSASALPANTPPVASGHGEKPSWIFRLNLNIEIPYHLTGISAWYLNCQVLCVPVCHSTSSRSPVCSPDIPEALQPTPVQLLTVHPRGIDGFPFPRLRDNLIKMGGLVFDEDEFTRDIYTMPCFTITPGGMPWDPRAWKVEKPFADKWGYLFH